jgi:hypothetical protein
MVAFEQVKTSSRVAESTSTPPGEARHRIRCCRRSHEGTFRISSSVADEHAFTIAVGGTSALSFFLRETDVPHYHESTDLLEWSTVLLEEFHDPPDQKL